MTMEECLYAVMLESANECAYAVAEHVGAKLGGNYQTFIDLMNEKAKELGCTNTHFNNANGLPDEDHWTSARDMALISAEAYKNENFRIIISTPRYVIPPTNKHKDKTYLNNHHEMIHNYKTDKYLYKYALGGKTGYTQAAGATLVSYG
jgi:D-alanyl-D-alanine carboxypeptidase